MAKGDTIAVYIRGLEGGITVKADKAGRVLEEETTKESGVTWLHVHEKTWTGKTVRTTSFAASEVIAVVRDITEEK
jgi:hypothetical protein